jgi:hypothetical protein
MRRSSGFVVALCVLAPATLWAAPAKPGPITTLPADKLQALAPLLKTTQVALIETDPKGQLKQLTTAVYAAASPEAVREVVIHAEKYKEFVRNTSECSIKQEPGGTFVHQYKVSYGIYTVDGRHRYTMLAPDGTPGAAPVDMYDPDDDGFRHFRWEFLPAAGGGTVVVLYGYNQMPRDGFMNKFLNAAPSLEYGLALIPQMTLVLAMSARAEQLTPQKPTAPSGATGAYDFLLERGTVALLRSTGGRLSDMSLIDRTSARKEVLASVFGDPGKWSQFVPTISRSTPLGSRDGMASVEMDQSLPLISFTSTFGYRGDAASADMFATSGDLRGGRLRWDLRPRAAGGNELVLRAILSYDKGSIVVRQLYKMEPFFEYGVNVGLGLVLLQGIRNRAEQLTQNRALR